MRHDPIYSSASQVAWPVVAADHVVEPVLAAGLRPSPDRLLLASATGMFLVSLAVTWAVLQTDWLYFPWLWMTVAGEISLLMGLAAVRPGGSFSIPRGSTKPPIRLDHAGLAFGFSGALWLVLIRAAPDMGSELDLSVVYAAASCSLLLSIVVACGTSSREVKVGALVYSALVVLGLLSIEVGHIPSIPEMSLSGLLLATCGYLELGKRGTQSDAAR